MGQLAKIEEPHQSVSLLIDFRKDQSDTTRISQKATIQIRDYEVAETDESPELNRLGS